MAQLQHNMWVMAARSAVLSIITGGGKWVELKLHADPLYQHLLLTAEKSFGAAYRPAILRACSGLNRHDRGSKRSRLST
jgi:hypothetical protein